MPHDPALAGHGPAAIPRILRLAARGDWRTRALSLSLLGRLAGAEPAWKSALVWGLFRFRPLRGRIHSAGRHGRYVRGPIANGLVDRTWPVRVAAALALGECRSPGMTGRLQQMLTAPFRPERIAAAAAILNCGGTLDRPVDSLLDGAMSVPSSIGDRTSSVEFLTTLASAHTHVLAHWPGRDAKGPADNSPAAWAAFLAGPPMKDTYGGLSAEIDRYDAEGETEYLLAKPFSQINRPQNVRLLHSFLVAAEHLRLPPGARVLDLGGGSAWVSELLARFGATPFTFDLAWPLLSIGQRRFRNASLTFRGCAADMTRLPVASASMDAVIVMDALHHVPDVPAVFREAHRVLGQGGVFLLAEPGEGHAETEKSRGEMIDYGVQEREIHVREAIDYGRAAGFDDVRVVPHYVPGITMTPEQIDAAAASSADDWLITHPDNRVAHFAPFVVQSLFDRPVMLFRKGERPLDSRMPGRLRADISADLTRGGAHVHVRVTVRNTGDTRWLGGGGDIGYVQLGVQLLTPEHRLLSQDLARLRLPGDVVPGEAVTLEGVVPLPQADGAYALKIDLVSEGICWFEDNGSRPLYVSC
jgi:SAM-dependent methyltransferase